MFSTQARGLLLQVGRASLEMWVRAGHMTEPGLASDAQQIYARMADRVPWPAQQANRAHLVFLVLPVAALYTALRERGKAEQDAVEEVQRAVKVTIGPLRQGAGLLLRTEPGRRLFMRTLAPGTLGRFFPAPAWQTTWTERSQHRVAFDVTRCYDLDMLRLLDAAPVARCCAPETPTSFPGRAPAHWPPEPAGATSASSFGLPAPLINVMHAQLDNLRTLTSATDTSARHA